MKQVEATKKFNIPQATVMDRAVKYFSPEKYVHRMKARFQAAAIEKYTGASKTRRSLKNFIASKGDADSDLLDDLPNLRERSRDLNRNNAIAAGATLTKQISVIGTGLRMQSKVNRQILGLSIEDNQKLTSDIEFKFKLFAESRNCDVSRVLNFTAFQQLAYRQKQENGDFITLFVHEKEKGWPFSLRLQIIEGDRLSNKDNVRDGHKYDNGNTVAGGVERNSKGAVVSYHILKVHPGALSIENKNEWDVIPAFNPGTGLPNILHSFQMLRPGQSRGLPDLSPVIELIKQIGRYTEAEIMAALVAGMFTVFIKTVDGESNTEPAQPGTDEEIELGYGAIHDLKINEEISTANPGRPNSAFDPFITSILQQIGMALGIPYELLVKRFMASFSASKAAIQEAWRFFKAERKWFIDNFCQPVFEAWLYEAVLRGYIHAPGFLTNPYIRKAYTQTYWVGDGSGHLNPLQEANAAVVRMTNKITTLEKEIAEYSGEDIDTNLDQIEYEKERLTVLDKNNNQNKQRGKQ